MDQQKPVQDNVVNEAFGRRYAELAVLWAVMYTIAGKIGPEIPASAGWLTFFLQTAVAAPVMAALRMTYKNSEMDATVRLSSRIMYIVMIAALIIMLVMAFS